MQTPQTKALEKKKGKDGGSTKMSKLYTHNLDIVKKLRGRGVSDDTIRSYKGKFPDNLA